MNIQNTLTIGLLTLLSCPAVSLAADSTAPVAIPLTKTAKPVPETLFLEATASIQRGINTLLAKQKEDGSWCDDPAVTAICTLAVYQSGAKENKARLHDAVNKGIQYFMKFQQADGAFAKDGRYMNYTTSIVLTTLAVMDRKENYPAMLKARHYLLDLQLDEDNATHPTTDSNPFYGGIGYGSKGPARPDLSNTQLALEALYMTEHLEGETTPEGQKWKQKSDLSWGKALKFLRQCQNIPDTAGAQWVVAGTDSQNDGGFIYKPEESKAGAVSDGKGLRSYGSMTYAGLKSMIYAKVKKDDFRVKAAREWAKSNYTLKENPGMGAEGHYYYLHTFSKANAVFGDETLVDKDGKVHHWRMDLVRAILNFEKDGVWRNDAGRWMESVPELVTAYSLLALEIALGDQLAAAK